MKVLVTGGAGFVGSNFVTRSLTERSDLEITVLDALTYAGSKSKLANVLQRIEFVEGDIRDETLVDSMVRSFDLVVHFAAESHNDNSLVSPRKFYDTNVFGTFNLAQACVRHGVRLHHVSTDEVFGDLPLESSDKFSASTAYNPSSPYSASKAASDHLVRAWVRSFGLQATISNCSNNYGPHQNDEKLIPATVKSIVSGNRPKVYGTGENVRDWIHVDDHTDGIWAIVDRGDLGQTYLLGASDPVRNVDLVKALLRHAGLPETFIEFVRDRAGHDRKYSIDASDTEVKLGWRPKYSSILDYSEVLLALYSKSNMLPLGIKE